MPRRALRWLLLPALGLGILAPFRAFAQDAGAAAPPSGTPDDLRRTPVVRAVEKVSPAVVNISTDKIGLIPGRRTWDEEPFGVREPPRLGKIPNASLGSGVVVDPDGYIITNSHVVKHASGIHVKFFGKGFLGPGDDMDEGFPADLVAEDPRNDLAILKLRGGGPFPFVEMGTSSDLLIGEPAIAIGNPYGLSSTVTTGVISALNRSVTLPDGTIEGIIQTDAAINPGNSGGPLLNIHGQLIGVNEAVYVGAQSIGFAIPVDRVKSVLAELIDPVRRKGTWIGVEVRAEAGAVVASVVDPDGPGRRAGVRPRDAILAVDGKPVTGTFDFKKRLLDHEEGDEVRLTLRRAGGETAVVNVKIAKVPGLRLARERLGLDLEATEVPTESRPVTRFRVKEVRRFSPADRLGVETGDVLDAMDGVPLAGLDALEKVLRTTKPGAAVPIRIYRNTRRGWQSADGRIVPD